ncbi:fimbria/pilus periplasmic chaperone [Pantoea sp. AS142]|uniref:fimbria/pilus periplasmic chaperone n=1 Tax=Pantoea sp. AS142 TaxID=3081292 RepID=UPI003017AD4C
MLSYRLSSVFSKFCVLISFVTVMPVIAAVNVSQTRVIFNEGEMAQSLALSNDANTPVVVQAWLDVGDIASAPDKLVTPVIATPPVFRMNPGEVRSLRLILTSRQSLKQGQENLFWLNIYQITPERSVKEKNLNQVVLPLRLRLKILIRPAGVGKLTEKEGGKIVFRTIGERLEIHNPTQWYSSISNLHGRIKSYDNLIIPPGKSLLIEGDERFEKGGKVEYEIVNDTGYSWHYQSVIK